ncbi:MAG: hypothetical protein Tsb002_28030 [Wenzhouxiangellaceae bacterium]
MRKIEPILDNENPDLILVTGDITNIGDKPSFDRVYQWIHDKIYCEGDYYGLLAKERGKQVIVVPGNHDAFNARTSGSNWKRWQSSLENYYSSFEEYAFDNKGVGYKWFSVGEGKGVFLCYVDSCYMGDEFTDQTSGALNLSRVAKGKFSVEQSEIIMGLYDEGIKGHLVNNDGNRISRASFLGSLKILMMHHYLFEPSATTEEPLLHLKDRRAVFQNLAMSDFDLLVCGHKHKNDFQMLVYLDHFDPRGKVRYAFNHIRRVLGIDSLPLRFDDEGKSQNRMYRFMLSVLYLSRRKQKGLTDETANQIIAILEKALKNKNVLKEELVSYLESRSDQITGDLFEKNEIIELHRLIMRQFKGDRKDELMRSAGSLRGLVSKLAGRPFAQIMAGSASKSSEQGSRSRSFNVYDISHENVEDGNEAGYEVIIRRYSWDYGKDNGDGTKGDFGHQPLEQKAVFPAKRVSKL